MCVASTRASTPSTRRVWWRSWRMGRARGGGAGTACPVLSTRAAPRPARKWVWAWSGTGWVQIHYSSVSPGPVALLKWWGKCYSTWLLEWYRTPFGFTHTCVLKTFWGLFWFYGWVSLEMFRYWLQYSKFSTSSETRLFSSSMPFFVELMHMSLCTCVNYCLTSVHAISLS